MNQINSGTKRNPTSAYGILLTIHKHVFQRKKLSCSLFRKNITRYCAF